MVLEPLEFVVSVCLGEIHIFDDIEMKHFLGEALHIVEVVVDVSIALVDDALNFLQLLDDELAALEDIDLDLHTLVLYVAVAVSLVY